jgi:protocatechuate 3,4-dioxygenase beta subunit
MQTLRQRHTGQLVIWGLLMLLLPCPPLPSTESQPAVTCPPTTADALGPFYKPDAPSRSKVGEGYVLWGVVCSTASCQPLAKAVVEFWLAGPDGQYSDAYRASVVSEEVGRYSFESHHPVPYGGRPAHIHIRVTAPGHRTLVTQHYPATGQQQATVDLVLLP